MTRTRKTRESEEELVLYEPKLRTLREIRKAEHEFDRKVWYIRKKVLAEEIASGKIKLVDRKDWLADPTNPKLMVREVWEESKKDQELVEKEFGVKNLGPWKDIDYGMILGKLSALRWVLSLPWDTLDT
jgi:hypothetical protein